MMDAPAHKLTLVLDADAAGLRASLIEEWEDARGAARMTPMIRCFDSEAQAVGWARSLARRRGLTRVYLTDNRKPARG
jgi:hypothetical protein